MFFVLNFNFKLNFHLNSFYTKIMVNTERIFDITMIVWLFYILLKCIQITCNISCMEDDTSGEVYNTNKKFSAGDFLIKGILTKKSYSNPSVSNLLMNDKISVDEGFHYVTNLIFGS